MNSRNPNPGSQIRGYWGDTGLRNNFWKHPSSIPNAKESSGNAKAILRNAKAMLRNDKAMLRQCPGNAQAMIRNAKDSRRNNKRCQGMLRQC